MNLGPLNKVGDLFTIFIFLRSGKDWIPKEAWKAIFREIHHKGKKKTMLVSYSDILWISKCSRSFQLPLAASPTTFLQINSPTIYSQKDHWDLVDP
jgi:acyl-coenzyme A synthetase/AMP-(fatty) acid ligase